MDAKPNIQYVYANLCKNHKMGFLFFIIQDVDIKFINLFSKISKVTKIHLARFVALT